MKGLVDYIRESMLKHIGIELRNYDYIYEKWGEYEGCYELAKYLVEKMSERNNSDELTIYNADVNDTIDNIVFDKLIIKYKDISSNAEYDTLSSEINDKTKLFKSPIIYVHYDFQRTFDKIGTLEHELTHMFNDYKIQSIGLTSFFDLFNTEKYRKSREFNVHNVSTAKRYVRNIMYILNEYEKNAFIATLCSQIREIKTHYFNDVSKINTRDANLIYNMTKDLDIYKSYENAICIVNDYYNGNLYDWFINDFVEEYNDINKTNLNRNQIFKIIKNKLIKVKKKLESIIPKKIAEELNIHHNNIDAGVNILNPNVGQI